MLFDINSLEDIIRFKESIEWTPMSKLSHDCKSCFLKDNEKGGCFLNSIPVLAHRRLFESEDNEGILCPKYTTLKTQLGNTYK